MKKDWLLLLIIFCMMICSHAQKAIKVDSLVALFEQKYDKNLVEEILDSCYDVVYKKELKGASKDKVIAYVLKSYVANLYYRYNIPDVIYYGERAIEAAEKCGDINIVSAASGYVGAAHLYLGNYGKGAEMFMKCYDINMKMDSVNIAVKYLHNIANAYQLQRDYDKALLYAKKSIDLVEKIDNYSCSDKARTLGLVASIFKSKGEIAQENNDTLGARKSYLEGLEYVRKACEADTMSQSINVFGYLNVKASCLEGLGKVSESKAIFQHLADTLKNMPNMALQYSIALYHLKRYSESYELSKKIGDKDLEISSLKMLILQDDNVDSMRKKFKDYITLTENNWLQENSQATARYNALFQVREKETELANMHIKSAEDSERFRLILAISIFLFVSAIGTIVALVRDRRRRRHLAILNSKLENNVLLLKKTNSVKDELIRVISHDLSGMVANVNMLSHMQKDAPTKEGGEMLSEQSDILKGLLDNLLVWARIQRSGAFVVKKMNISLNEVIDDVIKINSLVARQKGVTLKSEYEENPCIVETDRNLLHCIVRNLVSNAVKFTPEGGTVTVTFDKKHVCVSDTGMGMTNEVIEKIYKGGTNVHTDGTNGEPGSGLGLSIVRAMIQMSGAKFEIESEANKGSAFTVRF